MIAKVNIHILLVVLATLFMTGCATTRCIEGQCDNGKGTIVWRNGDKYIGEWINNKPNGKGMYIWKNGIYDQGDFQNGSLSGQGVRVYPSGKRIKGEWRDNKFLGTPFSGKEIKQLHENKTISFGKDDKKYYSSNGDFFHKRGILLTKGKWYIEQDKICYQHNKNSFCDKVYKKDEAVFVDVRQASISEGDIDKIISAFKKFEKEKAQLKREKRKQEKILKKFNAGKRLNRVEEKKLATVKPELFFKAILSGENNSKSDSYRDPSVWATAFGVGKTYTAEIQPSYKFGLISRTKKQSFVVEVDFKLEIEFTKYTASIGFRIPPKVWTESFTKRKTFTMPWRAIKYKTIIFPKIDQYTHTNVGGFFGSSTKITGSNISYQIKKVTPYRK